MAGLTEPVPGATPLDEDDLEGLIPTWVTTRADLDAAENDGMWQWAGQRRRRVTNIGVEPYQIATKLRDVFDDVAYWRTHTDGGFTDVEVAVRLHHRLVAVHPYPNGNGRHSRLMADAYLHRCGLAPLGWGGLDLGAPTESRVRYIAALRAADTGDYAPLVEFATTGTASNG